MYQAKENGEIRSVDHMRKSGKNGHYMHKGKVLKQRLNPSGYNVLRLSKNGVVKSEFVHVLIAKTFLPNPHDFPCVNHKDENKQNNSKENLEWCSNKYNQIYSFGKKVINITTGKLYESLSKVEEDGYCWKCVSGCCRDINKTHKGEVWKYYDMD